jgi:phospholipid transport system transporter-binding protein
MNELSIVNNIIYLRGEVSFKTVANLNQHLHKLVQKTSPGINTLDCSGITKVDSAIAALLVVVLKISKKSGTTITITHLPESVSKLIKLYDLQEIFELDKTLQLVDKVNSQKGDQNPRIIL